ncbi:MAG: type II secretion system F family protein [Dissulfuribacterales bacterium]
MAVYSYTALNPAGELIQEENEFPSLTELYSALRRRNLTLLRYKRKLFTASPTIARSIKRPIMAEFLRNLALLVRGGVPIRQAVEDLSTGPGDSTLNHVLKKILGRLDEGLLLSEAMKEQTHYFPKIVVTLASLGEETGSLDRTMEDASKHITRIDELISATKRAVSYPIFVIVAMMGALGFWLLYVLPKILELINNMGLKEIPLATRILMASVEIAKTWWPVAPGLFLLIFIIYLISKKNMTVKYHWDKFWMSTPILGVALTSSQYAFFFEYLSLLTNAGIQILTALELMEQSVSNRVIGLAIKGIKEDIMLGYTLSTAFNRRKLFEPFILRLVNVGEQTGNISEQLLILAKHYMDRVNRLVENLSKIIEPALLMIAGFIFIIIALGLLGPIYEIVSQMK